jgi:group I intron endonuclease
MSEQGDSIVMVQGGVYKILCTANGRFYIGSSHCITARWKEHRYQLERGCHKSRHMQFAWNKYGADAFVFEVLQYEGDRDAREVLEQHFLDTLQPFDVKGFNYAREVGTTRGIRWNDEQRKKITASLLLRRHSEATKERMRQGRLGALNPQHGRPLTEKQKASLHRSGEKHSFFGRKHSAETLRALSEQRQIPVWQISKDGVPIKLWSGSADAALAVGLKGSTSLHRACVSSWRKAAGFFWRYAEGFDPASFVVPDRPGDQISAAQAAALGRACRRRVHAIGQHGEVAWSWESGIAAAADMGVHRPFIYKLIKSGRVYGGVTFIYADNTVIP